jgi:hypothetical protein
MRRCVLHIAAALLTFSVSFLTVGKVEDLAFVLPLALCVFVFTKTIPELKFKLPSDFDSHKLKVAAITFLLWIPILVVFLPLIIPQSGLGNCTPDLP